MATRPERRSLDPLIRPASIAVIGASSAPNKAGHQLVRALDGFPGRLCPVNPGAREILGHPAYPEIGAIGEPVDLAVLVVPAATVPAVIGECAAAGTRAAIVCAGGFAETGPAGADLQAQAARAAAGAGMRLLGPNTSGLVNPVDGVRATFLSTVRAIPAGRLAIVAQSGGVNLAFALATAAEGLGVRLAVGLGNAVDVGHAELLDYLADDPQTAVVALHLEGTGDGRGLVEAVARAATVKPVIALVLGESDVSDFARSHTGALATSWRLTRAALGQAGARAGRARSRRGAAPGRRRPVDAAAAGHRRSSGRGRPPAQGRGGGRRARADRPRARCRGHARPDRGRPRRPGHRAPVGRRAAARPPRDRRAGRQPAARHRRRPRRRRRPGGPRRRRPG